MEILELTQFINKSVTIYGPSNSGKSNIINNFLRAYRKICPLIIVFTSSDQCNDEYSKKVPPIFIYDKIHLNVIKDIFDRQIIATKHYNIAHNYKHLLSIYTLINILPKDKLNKKIKSRTKEFKNQINIIKNTINIKPNTNKQSQIKILQQKYEYDMVTLYRIFIEYVKSKKYKFDLLNLNTEQSIAIKYLNFNPNILILFDDMAMSMKDFLKTEDGIKLYISGRHYHISILCTLQHDKFIDNKIRINTQISIFTKSNAAINYFTTKTNGFSSDIIKEMQAKVKIMDKKEHRIILYNSGQNQFIVYDPEYDITSYKFCCEPLWLINNEIIKNITNINDDNMFNSYFGN